MKWSPESSSGSAKKSKRFSGIAVGNNAQGFTLRMWVLIPKFILGRDMHRPSTFHCWQRHHHDHKRLLLHSTDNINQSLILSMAKSQLKLIAKWPSPYVMRVKIALNIKSLEYEQFEETLNSKSDLLLKSNPVYGKVPVLIHHDKPICDSLVIVEYIDETWSTGPSILPSDAYDRAVARFWAAYIDEKWFPSMKSIMNVEKEEERKPYFETMEEVLERMEDAFGKCSKGKPFFAGDGIGFLDIAFGSFLGWFSVIEHVYRRKLLVEAKAPALVKWAERFAADPAVKGLIPETVKLVEISKSLQIEWRAAIGKK